MLLINWEKTVHKGILFFCENRKKMQLITYCNILNLFSKIYGFKNTCLRQNVKV